MASGALENVYNQPVLADILVTGMLVTYGNFDCSVRWSAKLGSFIISLSDSQVLMGCRNPL
jgi:hypothetical protein